MNAWQKALTDILADGAARRAIAALLASAAGAAATRRTARLLREVLEHADAWGALSDAAFEERIALLLRGAPPPPPASAEPATLRQGPLPAPLPDLPKPLPAPLPDLPAPLPRPLPDLPAPLPAPLPDLPAPLPAPPRAEPATAAPRPAGAKTEPAIALPPTPAGSALAAVSAALEAVADTLRQAAGGAEPPPRLAEPLAAARAAARSADVVQGACHAALAVGALQREALFLPLYPFLAPPAWAVIAACTRALAPLGYELSPRDGEAPLGDGEAQVTEVYSPLAAGRTLAILKPGMRRGGALLEAAHILRSAGPPPPEFQRLCEGFCILYILTAQAQAQAASENAATTAQAEAAGLATDLERLRGWLEGYAGREEAGRLLDLRYGYSLLVKHDRAGHLRPCLAALKEVLEARGLRLLRVRVGQAATEFSDRELEAQYVPSSEPAGKIVRILRPGITDREGMILQSALVEVAK
jgi:hypothetical protein